MHVYDIIIYVLYLESGSLWVRNWRHGGPKVLQVCPTSHLRHLDEGAEQMAQQKTVVYIRSEYIHIYLYTIYNIMCIFI